MPKLHYLIGDALEPIKKPVIIIHCCNDIGRMGRGFVVPLAIKYPEAKKQYYEWFKSGKPKLGEVQFVQVAPDVCIANLIGQHDIKTIGGVPPIRYDALEVSLKKAYEKALADKVTVAGPRLGATLAGGEWSLVEDILNRTMTVETYIYTLEHEKSKWPTNYENRPM